MEPYLSNTLFEAAVDALIAGDAPALQAMLREDPELIRARSTRPHHATLLHYTGTNGVEHERQKYPPNAVEMLKLLLAAGAEVDAEADLYGGGATTFGLVATSVHPVKAGIMIPMLETLLEAGASIEHRGAGGNGQTAIIGCLHNGRPESADFLMRKGATLDLEAAAGTGRLDVVKTFFNEDGGLTGGATRTQLDFGFGWACEFGHTAVVDYLLDRGADPNKHVNGLSGFHWAILGAYMDIIQLLIRRGADLHAKNAFDGDALGAAGWAVENCDPAYRWPDGKADYAAVIRVLREAGGKGEPARDIS